VFLDFYQMREQPFGVTPDPRYLYFSSGHREALASLFYGIETGRGFLSLVAAPGMGKTTLLFQLLQRWKGYVHSAFLFQTQCNSTELIRYLLHDLGLNCDGEDVVRMHSELNQFLFREALAGRKVVVFIDEAQNLPDSALETVRLLSDFEATDKKLMQIVLAGQPELALRLARPGLAQLRQRIAVHARLEPLTVSEIIPYISHRLQVAGYTGPELFTPGALAVLSERSRGIPRLINHLCFSALSVGCALGKKQISSEMVREAAFDLSLEPQVAVPKILPRQTPQDAVPTFRSRRRSVQGWIKRNLYGRPLQQASAVFLLFGILGGSALYLAARHRPKPARSLPAVTVKLADVAKTTPTVLPAAQKADPSPSSHAQPLPASPAAIAVKLTDVAKTTPTVLPAAQKADPSPSSHAQPLPASPAAVAVNLPRYFTYIVQQGDTLHDICVSGFGEYDSAILSEVQELNPDLKDPNQLQVGEKIRLPAELPASSSSLHH
jgi:general secretion pathway protein A